MNKLTREQVYKVIDTERDYQDAKYGNTQSSDRPGNGERTIDEFALYITGLAQDLHAIASHARSPFIKLEAVREIAGLCVQCMEQHGAPNREPIQ